MLSRLLHDEKSYGQHYAAEDDAPCVAGEGREEGSHPSARYKQHGCNGSDQTRLTGASHATHHDVLSTPWSVV